MQLREARETDLEQINEIFNWHSENGFSTFSGIESLEKRKEWFKRFGDSPKHVVFVAEDDTKIAGLACSFAYRGGGVFENTIETSIYVHPQWIGKGIGSRLYEKLFVYLQGKGVHRIVVGIAIPNESSIAIHKKFGFEEIGVFNEYAFYKGEYRSSVWLQKKMN